MKPRSRNGVLARTLSVGDTGDDVGYLQDYLSRFCAVSTPLNRSKGVPLSHAPLVHFSPASRGTLAEDTSEVLRLFQLRHGLNPTGTLDEPTLGLIRRPRCGVRDDLTVRLKWVAEGRRWETTDLTYRLANGPSDIERAPALAAIREAMNRWEAVTPLRFREVGAGELITIGWFGGDHGDGHPFDTVSGVLAHAFYPPPNGGGTWSGDLHFDEAETWSTAETSATGATDLHTIALHELGHAIGLEHSADASAVMYAYYGGRRRELTGDDVAGARETYFPRNVLVTSVGSGEALDGGAVNKQVYLHPQANGANAWHRWLLRPVKDSFLVLSVGDGRALDAGAVDGWVYTHPHPSHVNNWQLWDVRALGASEFMLVNRGNGCALDGGAVQKLVYTHPSPNAANAWHRWRFAL